MARFLIEISHSEDVVECTRIIKVFLTSGSHLLTNAEWGCKDGVHTCYLIAEVENKEEALCIVPPAFRADAKIVELNRFDLDFINAAAERLEAERVG